MCIVLQKFVSFQPQAGSQKFSHISTFGSGMGLCDATDRRVDALIGEGTDGKGTKVVHGYNTIIRDPFQILSRKRLN
jgi:hypothetical protein